MSLQSLRADPEFLEKPKEEQDALVKEYVRRQQERNRASTSEASQPRNPWGITPAPERGPYLEDVTAPWKAAATDPTWVDRTLSQFALPYTQTVKSSEGPETTTTGEWKPFENNFVTKALSGLERGGRLALSLPSVAYNMASQAIERPLEQAPTVVGQPSVSTPISRVGGQLPDVLSQALVPGPKVRPNVVAAQSVVEDAKRLGIPLTAGETTGSPLVTRVESTVERLPVGGGPVVEYRAGSQQAAGRVAEGMGSQLSPGLVSPEAAGTVVKGAVAESAAAPATTYVQSLGGPTSQGAVAKTTQDVLRRGEKAARDEASALYREVENLAGSDPMALDNTAKAAAAVLERQRSMPFVEDAAAKRGAKAGQTQAAKAKKALEPPDVQPGTGDYAFVGEGEPPLILRLPGMDDTINVTEAAQGKPVTFQQARLLDVKLGDMIRHAQGPTKRQLVELKRSLQADMDAYAATRPGELGVKLRDANEFYRTRVIEPFESREMKDFISRKATEPSKLEDVVFNPTTAERTRTIKAEMERVDPTAWTVVKRRFGDRLLDAGTDPTTNVLDPERFLREVSRYTPETLQAILGDESAGLIRLVDRYQRSIQAGGAHGAPISAAAMVREFVGTNADAVIHNLAKRSPEDAAAIMNMIPKDQHGRIGRAWWDSVVMPASISPKTGEFSRQRFLTQLGRVDEATMKTILGEDVANEVGALRRVLQHQEKIRPLGDNPSGTAQILLAGGQLAQAAHIAGSIWYGNYDQATAQGGLMLGTVGLGKLLGTAMGIRLLTNAMRYPPTSDLGRQAVLRIGMYAAQHAGQRRRENGAKE